jgi:hypothetical protein
MPPRKRPIKRRDLLPERPPHDPLGLGDPHERLTPHDVNLLLVALCAGSGIDDERELPYEDGHAFVEWAYQTLIAAELVRLILDGLVVVRKAPGSRHGWEFKRLDPPAGEPVN